jgi:threonine/homoserine/homoserine lactone efflux protein
MLLLFALVAGISFLGSVHPGTVNVAVVQTTLNVGPRSGLWLALGGSLPELLYSAVAAGGVSLLRLNDTLSWALSVGSVVVLFVAGLLTLPTRVVVNDAARPGTLPFWRGMALASTNPQLIPFWSAVWLALAPAASPATYWAFSLGAPIGAFVLLGTYVWLAHRYRAWLLHYLGLRWLNWLSGGFLIGMACWQAYKLFVA